MPEIIAVSYTHLDVYKRQPYNIAPLNFEVKGAQEIRADFAGEGVNLLTVTGKHEIRIPKKKMCIRDSDSTCLPISQREWN